MDDLDAAVADAVQEHGFSGAIRVDREGTTVLAVAHGFADRARGIPNELTTRFAVASAAKGFTALAVVSLVVDGLLDLSTTARSLLGDDLPLIDDAVTVEQLLSHRSGIGDYLDEDAQSDITDYVMPVPVHQLDSAEAYLAVLDGFPQAFDPGERFAYCNGGFVVLALLAERASGVPFADLVRQRVCEPAGIPGTAYLRSDELPGDAALGYLWVDRPRTHMLHLPVLGCGDGGMYSTLDDIHRFWDALYAERIVPSAWVDDMTRPRTESSEGSRRYGLGFWLAPTGPGVELEGYDAGVSFLSARDPETATTWTVVANWSDGAWPVAKVIAEQVVRR